MKTYEEIVQVCIDNVTVNRGSTPDLKYNMWAAVFVISETFGKSYQQVNADIAEGIKAYETYVSRLRKENYRAENEVRRIANLERLKNG